MKRGKKRKKERSTVVSEEGKGKQRVEEEITQLRLKIKNMRQYREKGQQERVKKGKGKHWQNKIDNWHERDEVSCLPRCAYSLIIESRHRSSGGDQDPILRRF